MVDPVSDVAEDTEETAPTCATCGETILNRPTHRVTTTVEDGAVVTTHFCDEECLSAYEG